MDNDYILAQAQAITDQYFHVNVHKLNINMIEVNCGDIYNNYPTSGIFSDGGVIIIRHPIPELNENVFINYYNTHNTTTLYNALDEYIKCGVTSLTNKLQDYLCFIYFLKSDKKIYLAQSDYHYINISFIDKNYSYSVSLGLSTRITAVLTVVMKVC